MVRVAALDPRVKDMTGKRCGRLTVIAHAGSIRNGNSSAAKLGMPLSVRQSVDRCRLGAAGRPHKVMRLCSRGGEQEA
jgi:hypothetical protein